MTTTDPTPNARDNILLQGLAGDIILRKPDAAMLKRIATYRAEIEAAVIADLVQRNGVSAEELWKRIWSAPIDDDGRVEHAVIPIINEALAAAEQRGRAELTVAVCETTLTARTERVAGCCDTYPENKGSCTTWHLGMNGRCAYCDHAFECHGLEVRATINEALAAACLRARGEKA